MFSVFLRRFSLLGGALLASIVGEAWFLREFAIRLPPPPDARHGLIVWNDELGVAMEDEMMRSSPIFFPRTSSNTHSHPPPLRLCLLGESTADSVGVSSHRHGLAAGIAHGLCHVLRRPVVYTNCGESGFTARDTHQFLLSKLDSLRIRQTPPGFDVVCIALGVNDAFKLYRHLNWRRDLATLLDDLREICGPETAIVVIGVPNIEIFPGMPFPLNWILGLRARYLDWVARQVVRERREKKVYHVYTRAQASYNFCVDGVHASESGYFGWGFRVACEMLESFRVGSTPSSLV